MTLATPGCWRGRPSKRQRNRYDIHILASHDYVEGFTSENPSRMNSGFAYVYIYMCIF